MHLEVLRGNRADNKILQGLLATMRRRFGIQEVTFVFDGGMSRTLNLAAVNKAQNAICDPPVQLDNGSLAG